MARPLTPPEHAPRASPGLCHGLEPGCSGRERSGRDRLDPFRDSRARPTDSVGPSGLLSRQSPGSDGRGDRIRTCCRPVEHQGLTKGDTLHGTLAAESRGDSELAEVVEAWPHLAGALKAAVLAIVRAGDLAKGASR